MARRPIRFTLLMADGYKTDTLDDLRKHWDIGSVTRYFYDGTLIRWLKARKYSEAVQVEKFSRLDRDLGKKLCAVFSIDDGGTDDEKIWPPEFVEVYKRLIQITGDKNLLEQIKDEWLNDSARVAFMQDQLDAHVKDFDKIYLVANRFLISPAAQGKTYIGVGEKAVAVINSDTPIDLDILNIKLESIRIEGSTISIKDELAEIERLISSGSSKSSYMNKMRVLKKKCIYLKDAESLSKLGDLYKKLPEYLMAEGCYNEAKWIEQANEQPKPTTPCP